MSIKAKKLIKPEDIRIPQHPSEGLYHTPTNCPTCESKLENGNRIKNCETTHCRNVFCDKCGKKKWCVSCTHELNKRKIK